MFTHRVTYTPHLAFENDTKASSIPLVEWADLRLVNKIFTPVKNLSFFELIHLSEFHRLDLVCQKYMADLKKWSLFTQSDRVLRVFWAREPHGKNILKFQLCDILWSYMIKRGGCIGYYIYWIYHILLIIADRLLDMNMRLKTHLFLWI